MAPGDYNWWEARDYCYGLELQGQSDWRLPSRIEMTSIIDLGTVDPTIDLEAFPETTSEFFWTGSPVPFLNQAYGVRFELGFIYDHDPNTSGRVRCVRGDYTAPQVRFQIADAAVTDTQTGLMWQRAREPLTVDWADALARCEALDLDGHSDWRLPSLKELETLVDERSLSPATDTLAFPDTSAESMWSATPAKAPPNLAWAVNFTDGYSDLFACSEAHPFRCVRAAD